MASCASFFDISAEDSDGIAGAAFFVSLASSSPNSDLDSEESSPINAAAFAALFRAAAVTAAAELWAAAATARR